MKPYAFAGLCLLAMFGCGDRDDSGDPPAEEDPPIDEVIIVDVTYAVTETFVVDFGPRVLGTSDVDSHVRYGFFIQDFPMEALEEEPIQGTMSIFLDLNAADGTGFIPDLFDYLGNDDGDYQKEIYDDRSWFDVGVARVDTDGDGLLTAEDTSLQANGGSVSVEALENGEFRIELNVETDGGPLRGTFDAAFEVFTPDDVNFPAR
ncbi:MAG: hypothetical protein AAFV53_08895 [Myxococcota bacterium]